MFLTCFFLFSSCSHQEDAVIAQLQLRKMQSRTFVGHSSKLVAKEVIQVLQDEGYMVKSVNTEIGLVMAELYTNIETFRSKLWAYVFGGRRAAWKKHAVVEMTVNIDEGQNQSKVRVNYLVRIYDNLGHVVDVQQVLDHEIYIDFFNRIQRGLLKNVRM